MRASSVARSQQGFLVIAGVFLVVVLAGLVAYLATVSSTSQASSAADLSASRAYQAARAGAEWAAYEILRDPAGGTFKSNCEAGSATKNLTFGSTLATYTATVTCTGASITEGASTVKSYIVVSNGCNAPTGGVSCPNTATASPTYAEREVRLTIAK